MGANAQTSVPTFTVGQVLTAAQMNTSARTGVPVAADAAARDGLFGGTGEKTLAEGQLVYLEDLNIVQFYDGAAWATVGPTTSGVIQVKSTTKDDTFTMSSQTFADVTGLSVSITPTSASNKVLVRAVIAGSGNSSTSSNLFIRLLRGSTVIGAGAAAGTRQQIGAAVGLPTYLGWIGTGVIEFLDTPNTTSATTYKIQVASQAGAIAVYVNRAENDTEDPTRGRAQSTITAQEVAP